MGRTTRGGSRSHTPNVRPVQRVELSERNPKQRFIAVIICLLVASAAFIYALNGLMSNDSGWTNIEVSSSAETNCGEDFIFQYYIGAGSVDATAERKALTLLYTDIMVKSYELFHNDEAFEDVTNIYEINQHPNEVLEVDPVLYQAFETVVESGRREIYLAPIYVEYKNLFFCEDDSQTVNYDVEQNADLSDYFAQVLPYCNDPSMVNVELLGENRIRLAVSEQYLSFAKENQIEDFVDFGWMKNAFICDYAAEELAEKHYTFGNLTSCDGFTRNLDVKMGERQEMEYAFNIYDRQGNTIYPAGVMNYTGAISIVSLHNYPMSEKEKYNYYEFKNGDIRTYYIDATDGRCRSSVNNLVSYSGEKGCAGVLLDVLPLYISEEMDAKALKDLSKWGTDSIYGDNGVLFYTEEALSLTDLYEKDGMSYEAKLIK